MTGYAISGPDEAAAYLAHDILGPRLRICCETLLAIDSGGADDIFGTVDALKLRSSVTLFDAIAVEQTFHRVLDRYFSGEPDPATLALLEQAGGRSRDD